MRRRKRKNRILFALSILLILGIAGCFIYIGIYFDKLAKPKTIIGAGLDQLSYYLKGLVGDDVKYKIGDNFNINGNIKYSLDSEKYLQESATNIESLKKYKLIKNMSAMNTEYNIKQDKKNKRFYADINQKINDENILTAKYYSENSTQYYLANNITNTYVNNGSFNYFETLDDETTTKENIEYVYDYIIYALKENIKDEDFEKKQVNQIIDGKNKEVNKYSIRFTNQNIRKIINGTINTIKEDDKANKILSNTFSNFEKYKVTEDDFFLDSDESYTLNVYSTKYMYKPIKYELIYMKGDNKKIYSYEGNFNNGEIFIVEQDKLLYDITAKMKKNHLEFTINDSKGNKVGEALIERDSSGSNYTYSFDNNIDKYDFSYSSKFSNIKNNSSYTNEKKILFKIIKNKVSQLNGDIELTINVNNDVSILEDIQEAKLSSTLSEEQKNLYSNLYDNTKALLENK